MAWPTTSRDVALIESLRDAITAMPEWMELDPLPLSTFVIDWPSITIEGPRALVHLPQYVNDATSNDSRLPTSQVVVEVHVPVAAREAACAFGTLRDAIAKLRLDGVRILSAQLTTFERGKYVSATSASSSSVTTSTSTDDSEEIPANLGWSRSSSVAHKGEITLKLFQVPFIS